MPIKGLTDRRPRLPRLGKIHLGIKIEPVGKASYPQPTDYFVCPPEIQAVFGEKPKSLQIAFPNEDADQWASTFYRAYSSYRGLVCKGDGTSAIRQVDLDKAVDPKTGALSSDKHPRFWPRANRDSKKTIWADIDCPPESCQEYGSKQCRPLMNLQFLLPDVPGVGIWQIDTSSWNSMHNILENISFIKKLCGRLSLIPLTLSLVPREVQPEGVKKKVHVLQLEVPFKLADLFKYASLPAGQALLPESDLEAPEDQFPQAVLDGEPLEEGDQGTPPFLEHPAPAPTLAPAGTQAGQPAPATLATPAQPAHQLGLAAPPTPPASLLDQPGQASPSPVPAGTPAPTRDTIRDQIRSLMLFGPSPSGPKIVAWWNKHPWGYALDEEALTGSAPLSEDVKAEHLTEFLANLKTYQAVAAEEARKKAASPAK